MTKKDHILAFYEWLRSLKLGAYNNAITKIIAEKVETMVPGTYNEAEFAAVEAEAVRKKAEEAAKEKDADAAEELKDETAEVPTDGAESEAVEPVLAE